MAGGTENLPVIKTVMVVVDMHMQRIWAFMVAALLVSTCLTCQAGQGSQERLTLQKSLSEQSFHDSQWIFFKGLHLDVNIPNNFRTIGLPSDRNRHELNQHMDFDDFKVRKSILNIVVGLTGLGVGLGHAYMEQDQARVLNLTTMSLGISTMMQGLRELLDDKSEFVAIRGLQDIGQMNIGHSRTVNMMVRPAISLDSSVGLEFRAEF